MPRKRKADVPPPTAVVRRTAAQTVARAVLFVALLAGVGYLLPLHAAPDAPIRGGTAGDAGAAQTERRMAEFAAALATTTGGDRRDVVLHFTHPGPPSPGVELLTCAIYFYQNYALYPARATVGRGDRVVNGYDTLRAADAVPDRPWLLAHRVAAVATVPVPETRRGTVIEPVR